MKNGNNGLSKSNGGSGGGAGALVDAAQQFPGWVLQMRAAAQRAISEDDIEAIVKEHVKKAKGGDKDSRDFIFNNVLGGTNPLKGATFVQNNFGSTDHLPDKPSTGRPGSKRKVADMAARAAAGMPLHVNGDGGEDDD